MAKIDLKDAFFTIPIHTSQREYLRFKFQDKVYQFNWTLRPAIALLRELGERLIAYIDDILILAESKEVVVDQVEALIYLLKCLGFIINEKKSITTSTQVIEFLGLTVDSVSMKLKLPSEKMKKIRVESRKLADLETIDTRSLSRLLGKMNATSCVVPPAPLFTRHFLCRSPNPTVHTPLPVSFPQPHCSHATCR